MRVLHFVKNRAAGAFLFCAALCAVLTPTPAPGAAVAGELTVSAAASLTNAFTELKTLFEKKYPGTTVRTNFAASNPLLKQIQEGAPVDVFASADQETMDKADASKCILPASRKDFAANGLVLIVPKGEASPVKSAEDLRKAAVKRVAIGNPDSVPAGRYARAALQNAGLWDALKDKFIVGASVRQVLDYVARGEADAGFVYTTDALQQKEKVAIIAAMKGHKPVLYPLALVKDGKNPQAAQEFIKLVLSSEGQAVLAKYGFSKP